MHTLLAVSFSAITIATMVSHKRSHALLPLSSFILAIASSSVPKPSSITVYLDKKFLEPAIRAFMACVNAIEESDEGVYMTEISGPTIPLPIFPCLGYKMVPLGKNWSYGVAAIIFAAIEYKKCTSEL